MFVIVVLNIYSAYVCIMKIVSIKYNCRGRIEKVLNFFLLLFEHIGSVIKTSEISQYIPPNTTLISKRNKTTTAKQLTETEPSDKENAKKTKHKELGTEDNQRLPQVCGGGFYVKPRTECVQRHDVLTLRFVGKH